MKDTHGYDNAIKQNQSINLLKVIFPTDEIPTFLGYLPPIIPPENPPNPAAAPAEAAEAPAAAAALAAAEPPPIP